MGHGFYTTAFTPSVQAEQAKHGSRAAYARVTAAREPGDDWLTPAEIDFISARDTFYLATVSETGWPQVQHRGGPPGFVHVLDAHTLAWADFSGNRQYISIGNAAVNDRVAMIFVDYPAQRRLKFLGHMTAVEAGAHPGLEAKLEAAGYRATIEHLLTVRVEGFDWNCPQHITPRFTAAEVEAAVEPLRRQIADLQAQLARLKPNA